MPKPKRKSPDRIITLRLPETDAKRFERIARTTSGLSIGVFTRTMIYEKLGAEKEVS